MKLLIALTLLLSSVQLIAQDPITLESKRLKGDIAEWTSYSYIEDSTEIWLIDKHSFDMEGRLYRLESFNYGRKVNLEETTYNAIGKIAQIKMTGGGRGVRLKTFDYDSLKRPIRMEIITVGDSLPYLIKTWEYSKSWRIEEKRVGANRFRNNYTFYSNEKGEDTLKVDKNENGDTIGEVAYTYDSKGRMLSYAAYEIYQEDEEIDTFRRITEWKYPNDSTKLEQDFQNGEDHGHTKFIYDSNNELIYLRQVQPYKEIDAELTFSFKFDEQDNFIQKIRFDWGNYERMEKFEIVYRKK